MYKCRGKFRRRPRDPDSLLSGSDDQAEERAIPDAVRALGAGQTDFYLSLLRKRKRLRRNKVMIVGPGRVGKTSLLKRLTWQPFDPSEESTRGIDACEVDVTAWAVNREEAPESIYRAAVADSVAAQLRDSRPQKTRTLRLRTRRLRCGLVLALALLLLVLLAAVLELHAGSVEASGLGSSPSRLAQNTVTCEQYWSSALPSD
eukprot:COSAG04_NODE_6640_length_1286_cov_2.091828_1_plen_202_part_01